MLKLDVFRQDKFFELLHVVVHDDIHSILLLSFVALLYSFTEPDVNPATIILWKINTSITIGMVTMTVAADISPQGIVN